MIGIIIITFIFILSFFLIHKSQTKIKDIMIIILVVLCLEFYIFNFNSFRLVFNNYKEDIYTSDEFSVTNMEYNNETETYTVKESNPVIQIENINTKIGTVKVNAKIINSDNIKYNLLYTDKTSKNYKNLPEKVLVNNLERSKYTTCYLSGESTNLGIQFFADKGEVLEITSIQINKDVPFDFNIIRILVLIIITILIYKMTTSEIFKKPYCEKNSKQTDIIWIISITFIVILIWANVTSPNYNSIYNEVTNSILNGKISLEIQPSEELKKLENPYDITQRENVEYLWDTAYYNNSYYVYFGILPVLLLFIPLKLLNGIDFPTSIGVLIFSIPIIINLTRILILFYKKWFKELSFSYLVIAIIGTLSGSLLFWVNRRPRIYELASTAGFCFATTGFYLVFKSLLEEKVKYKKLFLGALSLALAVACRPNLLLVSLVFVPLIIKNIKTRKNILKFVSSIAIPYAFVGILLMVYNYIRFDNILEFGTSYQLTVNDMRNLQYRWLTIPTGIVTQLLKLPVITNTFPYFTHQYETISFFGYYYVEGLVCGLLILNPINFILLFLIGLKKKIKEKDAYKCACILTIVSIIICVANIVMAGTLQRYSMDYAWLLNISSYLTLFIIVSNIKSKEIKKYILKIAIIITMFMLFANLIVGGIVSENNFLEKTHPKQYYNIRYSICFWE